MLEMIASSPANSVIASEAKQSRAASREIKDWIASSQALLAMTRSPDAAQRAALRGVVRC
jgi:hypothetical protein